MAERCAGNYLGAKALVVHVEIGAFGDITHKLTEWLRQMPGTIYQISVQKNKILRTAKIVHRTLWLPGHNIMTTDR